jgi:hypothetical protein
VAVGVNGLGRIGRLADRLSGRRQGDALLGLGAPGRLALHAVAARVGYGFVQAAAPALVPARPPRRSSASSRKRLEGVRLTAARPLHFEQRVRAAQQKNDVVDEVVRPVAGKEGRASSTPPLRPAVRVAHLTCESYELNGRPKVSMLPHSSMRQACQIGESRRQGPVRAPSASRRKHTSR